MPMDCIPSAKPSVSVSFPPPSIKCRHNKSIHKVVGDYCVISSKATVKCRRTVVRPQSRRWWLWHFQWSYCEMSMDCNPLVWTSVIVQWARKIMFVLPIYIPANT
jgi:hypothetical protein